MAYYESVLDAMGGAGQVRRNYRLFMVPGMGHCGGGDGTTSFDMLTPLEEWVEQGYTARSRPRVTLDEWKARPHASAVSLSADGRLQGIRKHRYRREFRLQVAKGFGL